MDEVRKPIKSDFIRVAIIGSLFVFMAFFGLFFNVYENSGLKYTFPTYDVICDCHNTNVLPKDQYTLSLQWILKDLSIFIYALVFAIASVVRADLGQCLLMWLGYLILLFASYLISYDSMPIMLYLPLIPVTVQIIYISNYFYKTFLK